MLATSRFGGTASHLCISITFATALEIGLITLNSYTPSASNINSLGQIKAARRSLYQFARLLQH